MTLGDPQPLSRRQARELARDQGEEIASAHDAIPTLEVPVLAPAALRPASFSPSAVPSSRRSSRHHSGPEQGETPQPGDAGASAAESARAAASAEAAPVQSAPRETPPALSRRELRALHAREEAEQAGAADDRSVDVESAGVESAGVESADAKLADAELIEAELVEPEPTKLDAVDLAPSERMYSEPIVAEPIVAEPIVAEPFVAERIRADAVPSPATTGWTPPVGHWSVDTDAPRAESVQPDQSLDELINRGIGAGGIPTTTNALILPSIPHQPSSVNPISNTGEIMITGSFDLPRSLGSTGAHPNLFDSSEMDHMMDQLDADQLGGDSAPVSASRAVSTHASTRGMLTPPKKQRASLPMILVITTAALAVSVLALFVIGYLSGAY